MRHPLLMKVPNHTYLWFNFRNVLHCLIDCWYIQEVRTRCHTFWSKKHISFAKFVNVNCFSDRNSDWNSWRNSGTLGEFWNPGRILEELWENSGEILKEFWRNSGRIPWSSVFFQMQLFRTLPLIKIADYRILPESFNLVQTTILFTKLQLVNL